MTIAFNDNNDSLNEHCPLRSEKMYRQDIVGGGKVVVTVETEKLRWNSRGASKRGKVRWRSFALMSVGARHSIRGRVMAHRRQAHAYQKRTRDKRDEEVAFSTSETIRTVLRSSRTHKRGERNGSCSCALPRALRCSTLRIRFYRSATSPSLFLSFSFSCLHPALHLSTLLLFTNASFSPYFVHPMAFLLVARAPPVFPRPCSRALWHVCTHTFVESCVHEDHRTRHLHLGRLPTPNGPTATVDTLPNFFGCKVGVTSEIHRLKSIWR